MIRFGLIVGRGSTLAKYLKKNHNRLLGVVVKARQKRPGSITMYDDVSIGLIPKTAPAVAGYVGGHWPTFPALVRGWPHAHKLSIAVSANEDADCLDIEPGDAVPAQAASWVRRQHARGKSHPVVYTSAAFLQHLVDTLGAAGLKHGKDYLIWSAHYTGKRHRCSSACGFGIKVTADATQYTDLVNGRNLDVSVCAPSFFAI